MRQVTVTQADGGRTLDVQEGDEITVQLPENPGTGYKWAVERRDRKLALREDSFVPQSAGIADAPQAIGRGGTRVLTLIAKSSGTAQLNLKHYRSWVGDSSITERFSITFRISGAAVKPRVAANQIKTEA